MRKGRFEKKAQRRSFSGKAVALMMACFLLLGGVVGGTVAWLTAQDAPVVNKFSPSTIGVELKEHTYDATKDALTTNTTDSGVENYKMIPGWRIPKDPEAWITEDSEAAYLFVKIEETDNFDTFMTYAIADGWKLLDDTEAASINTVENDTYVIYREVDAGATATAMDQPNAFQILKNDQITVIGEGVTAEMMTADRFTKPTLTFTAYAHQLYNGTVGADGEMQKFGATTAWNNLTK